MIFIAVILNIAAFVMGFVLIAHYGVPDLLALIVFLILIACPLANGLVLLGVGGWTRWFRLYLKRKAIEEKKKIEALEKGNAQNQ